MIQIDSFVRDLQLIKERSPLIHNITNYVVTAFYKTNLPICFWLIQYYLY